MPYTLTVKKTDGKPGQVWYPLQLNTIPQPTPGPGQLLVKISAVALNHRDLFIRQHLYPSISFTTPLLSDASGVVVALGGPSPSPLAQSLLHRAVLLTPSRGWDSDPHGPEDAAKFSVIGASALCPDGTAAEYVVVEEGEVVAMPGHLSVEEGAALPLVGVTAWRAVVGKSGEAERGRNILVTGKTVRLLKVGGVIVVYGMTTGPKLDFTMQAVLKNVEVRGSTMGSRREFAEMVEFVEREKIRPVVSRVVKGLDNLEGIEGLFEDMKKGRQFGKLVVLVDKSAEAARL